jgi:hypothetical protein
MSADLVMSGVQNEWQRVTVAFRPSLEAQIVVSGYHTMLLLPSTTTCAPSTSTAFPANSSQMPAGVAGEGKPLAHRNLPTFNG